MDNTPYLKIGEIVMGAITCIQPMEAVTLYINTANGNTPTGITKVYYETIKNKKCRSQPYTDELSSEMYDKNREDLRVVVEKSKNFRHFYFNNTDLSGLNRDIGTAGDYIQRFDGTFWRIVKVLDQFNTRWIRVFTIQTNKLGD